jgi:hypothetical protein
MRKIKVNLTRNQIVKSLMGPLSVVKPKPLSQALSQFGSVAKRPQIKVLILERPPQPLDENIGLDSATAIHADSHIVRLEQISKGGSGELSPLIGIEDFRCSKTADGLLNGLDTKIATRVLDTRQDKTLRLCQSMTATRYMNPRLIGM